MSQLISIGSMIRMLSGRLGTRDLTMWESKFVEDMVRLLAQQGKNLELSDAQAEKLEQIWQKHFA